MTLAEIVTHRIRTVIGHSKAALHEPTFHGNEWSYVKDCIDTGWVSSVGAYVDRFERELAAYTGCRHAVVVSNGTSGLLVALQLSGVLPRDEVLIPALSFVATANAVRHCGAEPHFVDSDYASLGMSVPALAEHLAAISERQAGNVVNRATGRRLGAIVPMHTFGHPVDMPALVELSRHYGIPIVEDAAESLGSMINGRHVGTYGVSAVLSFNGNKIVTTGGGGAILTNDADIAKRAKHLTTTAKLPHAWNFVHDEVAYNFRMPNLNAAMGCAQLEKLESFIEAKRSLARLYSDAFQNVTGVQMFMERAGTRANYWLQTLLLDASAATERDEILARTNDAGQMSRPAWELLFRLPMYRGSPKAATPVAEDLGRRIINIPSSPILVASEN